MTLATGFNPASSAIRSNIGNRFPLNSQYQILLILRGRAIDLSVADFSLKSAIFDGSGPEFR